MERLSALPTFVKTCRLTFAVMTVAVVPIPIVASGEDNSLAIGPIEEEHRGHWRTRGGSLSSLIAQ